MQISEEELSQLRTESWENPVFDNMDQLMDERFLYILISVLSRIFFFLGGMGGRLNFFFGGGGGEAREFGGKLPPPLDRTLLLLC